MLGDVWHTARAYVKKVVFFDQYWDFFLTEEPGKKNSSRNRVLNTFLTYHISWIFLECLGIA